MTDEEEALVKESESFIEKFKTAMEDDFNTADAISAVFELVKFCNQNTSEESSEEFATALYDTLEQLCDVLGIIVKQEQEILDSEIEEMIEARHQARKNKDFAKADEIRDALLAKGILLEDTREGVKWKRV